jgi:hypothetical protein
MAKRDVNKGAILLINGIDVSKPAEYIGDNSSRNSENFEISRGVLVKRDGTTQLGGLIGLAILTLSGNASDTETVTVGTKVYTFQTSLTNVDGNVLIGASASDSIDNLIVAINLGAGAGTKYATATTTHPESALASAGAGDTMDVSVNQNSSDTLATTETLGSGSWGAAAFVFPTDVEIMAGREFVREDVNYNVRVSRDKIENFNNTTSKWIDITGTDLTGESVDLVDTAIPLLSGKRILCVTNGVDAIRKWTASGDTADLGGTPPVCKFIQEFKTYLVCANVTGGTDVSQRVQWSDTADPENWSTGNSGSTDLIEDGEDITGLDLFGNYICVHKEKSIYLGYLVSSSSIFKFDRKATGIGTVANASIQNLPSGEQIFLAKDGIYLFNGIGARIADPEINEEIRDSLNSQYANKAWSVLVREKSEVWIGVPIGSQTTGETVYKYNYDTGIMLKDTRTSMNAAWLGTSSAGLSWDEFTTTWDAETERWDGAGLSEGSDEINLSDTAGFTYKVSPLTKDDDSVAVSALFESKDYQDSQQRAGRFTKLELWAKGSTVTVEYSTDKGETWTAMGASPFTLTSEYPDLDSPDIFYFDVVASNIRFRFKNETSEESLAIKQFIISYKPREMRQ